MIQITKVKKARRLFGGTTIVNFALGRYRIKTIFSPPRSFKGQVIISVVEGLAIGSILVSMLDSLI